MSVLYERIENLCTAHGVNITEMCRSANVPRSAISDYKTGRKKSISTKNIEKIANYFDISTDYLLGRSTSQLSDELQIPDVLNGSLIAFNRGEFDGLTQSEVNTLAAIAATLKKERENKEG